MTTRLYTTAVITHRRDGHQGHAEDFQVYRAENMPRAALYARQHHERLYGTLEPVTHVRVYHSCDTCPSSPGLFTDDCGIECCKYAAHGDCHYSGTHTEYPCTII